MIWSNIHPDDYLKILCHTKYNTGIEKAIDTPAMYSQSRIKTGLINIIKILKGE